MLSDLLPILGIVLALVVLPVILLGAMRRRVGYCGRDPNQCFWCNRDCEYYDLKQIT